MTLSLGTFYVPSEMFWNWCVLVYFIQLSGQPAEVRLVPPVCTGTHCWNAQVILQKPHSPHILQAPCPVPMPLPVFLAFVHCPYMLQEISGSLAGTHVLREPEVLPQAPVPTPLPQTLPINHSWLFCPLNTLNVWPHCRGCHFLRLCPEKQEASLLQDSPNFSSPSYPLLPSQKFDCGGIDSGTKTLSPTFGFSSIPSSMPLHQKNVLFSLWRQYLFVSLFSIGIISILNPTHRLLWKLKKIICKAFLFSQCSLHITPILSCLRPQICMCPNLKTHVQAPTVCQRQKKD